MINIGALRMAYFMQIISPLLQRLERLFPGRGSVNYKW